MIGKSNQYYMNFRTDPVKSEFPAYSFVISVLLHALIFFITGAALQLSINTPSSNSGYIQIATISNEPEYPVEEKAAEEQPAVSEETAVPLEEQVQPQTLQKPQPEAAARNVSFNSSNTDTTNLNNIYSEKTLNVSIKYPAGWAYIDQNRKNKLDGVTFMAASGNIKPPPYVHLAVQTKDMFIESRYKYTIKTWNYIAYYNDPEEMAGQVSQVFYIRTETDEDYSIKFIMKGMDNFKAFQPVFFGMVKTFKFGGGFF